MHKQILSLTGLLLLVGISLYSCSEKASSSPSYIFKPAPSPGVAFKIGDEVISEADLQKGIESDLYEAESKVYELKMNRLQGMVLEKLMLKDKRKAGLSNDEFLDKFIAPNVKPSSADIEKFIKERGIPQEQVNEQMRERVVAFLTMEMKKVAVDKWIAKETGKSPVEVYLNKPTRPVFAVRTEGAPFAGGADAKVTIVEFSDFQCPFCSKGAKIMEDLKKKYGNKIRIAFKQFPLPFHQQARGAASASLCANEQDPKLFWKLHDFMFANQNELSVENLKKQAKTLGLNETKFNECLDKDKFAAQIDQDMLDGQNASVKSTPTFFVNGMMVNGAHPVEVFSEMIDEELKK